MADHLIPGEVREFIESYIDSIAQLEALLLLRGDPTRTWDPDSAAHRLYIQPDEAKSLLAKLTADGFLAPTTDGYRFECPDPQIERVINTLAQLYARHLIPVTRLVHSKRDRISQFADAFKLRRER